MIKASALMTVAALSIFRFAGYFNEPRLTDTEIHAIAGEPAGVASTGVHGGRPLAVVSWNIERGVQFQKIVSTLRALEPDVVLLQEVDRYCRAVIAASKQHGDRAVIAGDFNNDGAFQSFMFEGLDRAGFVDTLGATPRQTSINQRHPIDWIFVRGGKSTGGRVGRVDDTSDHYPLVARLSR